MSQPETEIYTYTQKQIFEGKTEIDFTKDEHPRLSSLESLANLKPLN